MAVKGFSVRTDSKGQTWYRDNGVSDRWYRFTYPAGYAPSPDKRPPNAVRVYDTPEWER